MDTIDLSARSAIEIILSSVDEQTVDSQLKITISSINDFENVIGTPGADTITGNEADNVITGGAGNDTLEGDFGDDTYVLDDGWGTDTITEGSEGDGIDSINFTAVASNVNVTIAADGKFTFSDGPNSVAFDNIEALHGGTGVNTLDFALSDRAVVVDIAGGTSTDFETLSGFDNVIGSPFGDTIIGNDRANKLQGGAGNDQLSGGTGADVIDGGLGIDTLIESRDVNFTLTNTQLIATGTGIVGSEVDTLAGIEFARLTGGASTNALDASGFHTIVPTTPLALLNHGAGANLAANDLEIHADERHDRQRQPDGRGHDQRRPHGHPRRELAPDRDGERERQRDRHRRLDRRRRRPTGVGLVARSRPRPECHRGGATLHGTASQAGA